MDIQKPSPPKPKSVPQNLLTKLQQLASTIGNPSKAHWQNNSTIILADCPEVTAMLSQMYDMSFKTFIKFIEMVGCKVRKVQGLEGKETMGDCYRVTIPEDSNGASPDNEILRKLLQGNTVKQESAFPNFEQLSIELNLRHNENEMNVESENEFKDRFLKNFKSQTDSINEFAYRMIYKMLVTRTDKKMSPCEVLELLTEFRDRIFENQRELEQCIEIFREKIRGFESESANLPAQNTSINRMIEEKEEEDGENQNYEPNGTKQEP